MKKLLFYLLFAAGALGGGSCQKSDVLNEPHPTTSDSNVQHLSLPDIQVTIAQTRTWFEARLNNATVLNVSVAYTKPLNWDWAHVEAGNNGDLLITVPEEDYFTQPAYSSQMSTHGCRSLIFVRNEQGGYRTEIMELRPDDAYIQHQVDLYKVSPLNLRPLIHSSDYTGYVLYFDGVNGKLMHAVRYESGQPVHTLQIPS